MDGGLGEAGWDYVIVMCGAEMNKVIRMASAFCIELEGLWCQPLQWKGWRYQSLLQDE